MSWFLLSIFATLAFAIVNIADKILLVRFAKTDIAAIKILGFFSLLFFLVTISFASSGIQFSQNIWLPVLAGIFEVTYIYWYLKAIADDMVAFVVPFFSLAPIFVLMVNFLFFQKSIGLIPVLGILLVIGGIILLTYAKESTYKISNRQSIVYMLLSAVFFGVSSLFLDAGLESSSWFNNLVWSRLGVFIGAIIIAIMVRGFNLRDVSLRTSVFAISELLYLLTMYIFIRAIDSGSPELVLGIGNIQPLFVLLFSYILFRISPSILGERFYFSSYSLAVVSVVVIVFGSWLIQIN